MKKLCLAFLLFPILSLAQTTVDLPRSDDELAPDSVVPVVEFKPEVPLGDIIRFSAEGSKIASLSTHGRPSYYWDFGDGSDVIFGEKVDHEYTEAGSYQVKLGLRQGQLKAETTSTVLVYDRQAVLITDASSDLTSLDRQAAEQGIWLQKILASETNTGLSAEDELVRKIQENLNFLAETDLVLFSTRSNIGLQSFAQFWTKLSPEKKFDLSNKLFVQISSDSLTQSVRLAQPAYKIIEPDQIFVTRPEAINPIFESGNTSEIEALLSSRGIEYQVVNNLSGVPIWLPFSRLLTYFVTNGISQSVLYILLSVPFLALVISFARQFVGISTFGVFAPLMLALSFLVLGWQFGLMVFLVVLLVSNLIRVVFNKVELLYIPKVSLLLSTLSLSFLLVLGVAVYLGTSLDLSLAIFPMMVMSTVSEKFLSAQSAQGMQNALIATAETVIVSLLAYLFVEWSFIRDLVLATPEYVILPILANIWLGRFTGLRISEYFKFRSLLKDEVAE